MTSARQIRWFGSYKHQNLYLSHQKIVFYGLNMRGGGLVSHQEIQFCRALIMTQECYNNPYSKVNQIILSDPLFDLAQLLVFSYAYNFSKPDL